MRGRGLMAAGGALMLPWLYSTTTSDRLLSAARRRRLADDDGDERLTPVFVRFSDSDNESGEAFFAEGPPDRSTPWGPQRSPSTVVELTATNAYSRVSPIASGGDFEYPWRYVAEPYRPTTLSVNATTARWVVDGHVQGYGQTVDVTWTSVGWKRVAAVVPSQSSSSEEVACFWVMVKYVRREMRSLTDRDREMFLQAAMVLQRVPTEVGLRRWGRQYRSKDFFTRMHLYFGGTKDCDHWHQGAGFVTSHVAFTLAFERALQSIYPSVTVPYWDITLESTFYEPDTWRNSLVFAPDWFGAAAPDNDLRTVTKGRWAFVPATYARPPTTSSSSEQRQQQRQEEEGDNVFSDVQNSYGLLRAPWNNDPTPFLTRASTIYGLENNMKPSGCKEYALALKKTDWMAFSRQLNSAAHGHIHETVGGSWNHAPDFYDPDTKVTENVLLFAHEIQALSKELWRVDYVQCPQTCATDTPWRECQCKCPAHDGSQKKSYDVLFEAGVLDAVDYYDEDNTLIDKWLDNDGHVYYTLPGYTANESIAIYDQLLRVLCSPGHVGDMFQASSPNDLTFWVLHPAVDRLWHFKRLGDVSNFDDAWQPFHTCYGHNPDDVTPFDRSLFHDDVGASHYYTNAQLYDLFDPASATIPYIYDNFFWPHCDLVGHDMVNH